MSATKVSTHSNEKHSSKSTVVMSKSREPQLGRKTAPAAAIEVSDDTHAPILAERFRTKLCRSFIDTGSCAYLHRCMFAHGAAELRTTAQNVADRLFSEEAIRAFKRNLFEKTHRHRKARPAKAARASKAATPPPATTNATTTGTTPTTASLDAVSTARLSRVRRHDPYALKSEWHPLRSEEAVGMSDINSYDGEYPIFPWRPTLVARLGGAGPFSQWGPLQWPLPSVSDSSNSDCSGSDHQHGSPQPELPSSSNASIAE